MERALRSLGFHNIIEMPHGKTMRFAGVFELTSYQTSWISDSAIVIKADGVTLLNLNDTKFVDSVFEKMIRRHTPIDFVFRSHSSAQAYPSCYQSEDPRDLQLRSNDHYINDFYAAARRCQARYAVPFASNVCFLHKESFDQNNDTVSPLLVKKLYRKINEEDPDVVVMLPGATWESREGFRLVPADIYDRKDEVLHQMRLDHAHALAEQDQHENQKQSSYETFHEHMTRFLKSLPWLLKWLYQAKVAFSMADATAAEWWVLDFGRRQVYRTRHKPIDAVSILSINPALLQDAMEKNIVNFIDISKRLRIELRPRSVIQHLVFKELITMYEMGYFPLWKNFSSRFVGVWFCRRAEILSHVAKILRGGRSLIPKVNDMKPL
jgi:UDP-MurNAc hydroxylase